MSTQGKPRVSAVARLREVPALAWNRVRAALAWCADRGPVRRVLSRLQSCRRLRRAMTSALFCGPALLLYTGFVIVPAVLGFTYSLTDWNGWTPGGTAGDLAEA